MIAFFVISVILAGFVAIASHRRTVTLFSGTFYMLQGAFALWILLVVTGQTSAQFFTFDITGVVFFSMLALIAPLVWWHSVSYLDTEPVGDYKMYHSLLILLCAAITGVYFANNLAVTWIFLEATTICTAGLVYHRRSDRSLEATWKYVFVCSTGIAIAYLGILLLSTVATNGDLSYANLVEMVSKGNPLYVKLAFLFILVGYSCKLEIFPLYTIGVDANHAAPTPASALVSTALVNAGFVSILRVYKIIAHSHALVWSQHVLIAAGVFSLLFGAFFLRRTNHFKRLLSYSTVENMGLVVIGMGIGGVGLFAAVVHVIGHTFIKSGLFLQLSHVGKIYGTYRINRIGDYMRIDRLGALIMIVGTVMLLAFPPSPLFLSEMMFFKQMVTNGQWWLVVVMVLLVCIVMYSLCGRVIAMCYQPSCTSVDPAQGMTALSWAAFMLVAFAMALGVCQCDELLDIVRQIADIKG